MNAPPSHEAQSLSTAQPATPVKEDASPVRLVVSGKSFDIHELSEFSFFFFHPGTVTSEIREGTIEAEGVAPLAVRFRPRNVREKAAIKCSFVDLSLKDKTKLSGLVALSEGTNRKGDQLEGMSYDDIASAKSTPTRAKSTTVVKAKSSRSGRGAKIATVLGAMLGLAIIGGIIIAGVVKSKGSIPLVNSTLVGNYLAVESLSEGVIENLSVSVDEEVKKGQILFYIEAKEDIRDAQERSHEIAELDAQIAVYEAHVALAEKNLSGSVQTMAADLKSIDSLVAQASRGVDLAQANEDKLRELMAQEVIGAARVNDAAIKTAQAQLELETYSNERRQMSDRLAAASEGRFIANEQTQVQRQQSQLALGLAKARRDSLVARQDDFQPRVPVRAPISGIVTTIYQEPGTYVKAGETVVAMTRQDHNWAIGHVLAEDAPKVKPGQKVTVRVPSMKTSYTGLITGIGHRSVYSQGEWSSDFRTSVPSSTPIKVNLPEVENLPSGLRMEMTVKLEDVWPWESWLDEQMEKRKKGSDPLQDGEPSFAFAKIFGK